MLRQSIVLVAGLALLASSVAGATQAVPVVTSLGAGPGLPTQVAGGGVANRVAGADRYGTAAQVASAWEGSVALAYVVQGGDYYNAITTASRAGANGAPVLLTKSDSVPGSTRQTLARLRPERIVVVGDASVVTDAVVAELRTLGGGSVQRISGSDHYEISSVLAGSYAVNPAQVYLASGENYPDGLAAAALAAHQEVPLLLVRKDRLDPPDMAQLRRLAPSEIVIVGGTDAVSDAVAQQAEDAAGAEGHRRIGGTDRYETSEMVADEFEPGLATAYMGSGESFPDALVGAALAGYRGAPILLTGPDRLPTATQRSLARQRPGNVTVLGGKNVVADQVLREIEETLAGEGDLAPREPDYAGQLSWQENFDGSELDTDMWTADSQPAGTINQEFQEYTPRSSNVEVSDGVLRLTARREGLSGAAYTSGKIKTLNKVWFQHGYVVARIKVPQGQGLWPAFWTLGRTDGGRWWPGNGEIDILESVNDMNLYQGGVHGGEDRATTQSDDWWHINRKTQDANLSDGQFHLYAMDWTEGRITFYLDNVEVGSIGREDMPAGKDWPFDRVPHYLLLNLAVGGTWLGAPSTSTPFPATMEVDWVRAYDSQVTRAPGQ